MNLLLAKFLALFFAFFQVPGQTPVGIFGGGIIYPGQPASGMQLWISADCVILTGSTCSSPANNTQFTGGGQTTWADRSANAANANWIGVENGCVFNTGQINGLPAVNFSANCGFTLGGPVDVGGTTTTWTEFIVVKNKATGAAGEFMGGNSAGGAGNSFSWFSFAGAEQATAKAATATIGTGTAAQDTSFHVLSVQYIIGTSVAFTKDGATDATVGFSSQTIPTASGLIGIQRTSSVYEFALNGYIAEFIVYSSASTPLSGANITATIQYLRHKYGQI